MSEWQSLQSDVHEEETKSIWLQSGLDWAQGLSCMVDKIQVGLRAVSTFLRLWGTWFKMAGATRT